MFVADTHALVWHVTADDRLGGTVGQRLAAADAGEEEAVIPTIVLAEAMYIAERTGASFDDLMAQLDAADAYDAYPLNRRVLGTMHGLDGPYSIHDAVIVATAQILGATVLTQDAAIQDADDVPTAWH